MLRLCYAMVCRYALPSRDSPEEYTLSYSQDGTDWREHPQRIKGMRNPTVLQDLARRGE